MAQLLMDSNWDKARSSWSICCLDLPAWDHKPLFDTHAFHWFFWHQGVFISQLEIIIKKKQTLTVRVDEQWVSEKEMKADLNWSPTLVWIYIGNYLCLIRSFHVFTLTVMFKSSWLHTRPPDSQPNPSHPRARIAGAKKACEAKESTHIRLVLTQVWTNKLYIYTTDIYTNAKDLQIDLISFWEYHLARKNAYDNEKEYYVVIKETGSRAEERSQEEIHRSLKKASPDFHFKNILLW